MGEAVPDGWGSTTWVGHVASMRDKINVHRDLVEKPKGRTL